MASKTISVTEEEIEELKEGIKKMRKIAYFICRGGRSLMRCVDTAFLIDLLRNDLGAVNVFESVFGIYRAKQLNHKKRIEEAEKLFNRLVSLVIIDIPDGMTAAIPLANGCNVVVTRNAEHFGRMPQVKVESY